MNRVLSLATLLFALLWLGGAPAFAEAEPNWKVMTPVSPSGPAQAPAAPAAAAPSAAVEAPAYLAEDQPFKLKDYEEPKPQAPAPMWSQALGLVFKLAIVLGLVFATMVVVKKLSGGNLAMALPLGAKGRNMVVLESTTLGPNQAMHLVSVGGERLLVVGAGPQGLATLLTIDDPAQVRVMLAASRGQSNAFSQVYDMETVVQDPDGELFRGALRDIGRRGGWGG